MSPGRQRMSSNAFASRVERRPRRTRTSRCGRAGARSLKASSRWVRRREPVNLSTARAARYGRAANRWARLLASGRAAPGVRVFYGHDRVPGSGERAAGGTAKAQKLNERFTNAPADFSLLYLG